MARALDQTVIGVAGGLLPGPGAPVAADAQNAARNRQRVAIELQARVVGAVAVGRIDPAPILTPALRLGLRDDLAAHIGRLHLVAAGIVGRGE